MTTLEKEYDILYRVQVFEALHPTYKAKLWRDLRKTWVIDDMMLGVKITREEAEKLYDSLGF